MSEITQADRIAMAEYDAVNPYADDDEFLAIFARHRIEARKQALEEAAHKATSFLVGDPENGVPLRNPMAHEIATAIRQIPLTASVSALEGDTG